MTRTTKTLFTLVALLSLTIITTTSMGYADTAADADRIEKLEGQIQKLQDRILVLEDKKDGSNDANIDQRIQKLQDKIDRKQAIIASITPPDPEPMTDEPMMDDESIMMDYIPPVINQTSTDPEPMLDDPMIGITNQTSTTAEQITSLQNQLNDIIIEINRLTALIIQIQVQLSTIIT